MGTRSFATHALLLAALLASEPIALVLAPLITVWAARTPGGQRSEAVLATPAAVNITAASIVTGSVRTTVIAILREQSNGGGH